MELQKRWLIIVNYSQKHGQFYFLTQIHNWLNECQFLKSLYSWKYSWECSKWLQELMYWSNMSPMFPCRYSSAEGSMKPASLLLASAAEPLFPDLLLLTRTDCGCQPPHPPDSLSADSRAKTITMPIPPTASSAIATHTEQSQKPVLDLHHLTAP